MWWCRAARLARSRRRCMRRGVIGTQCGCVSAFAMLATVRGRPDPCGGAGVSGACVVAAGADDPAHRAAGGASVDDPRGVDGGADRDAAGAGGRADRFGGCIGARRRGVLLPQSAYFYEYGATRAQLLARAAAAQALRHWRRLGRPGVHQICRRRHRASCGDACQHRGTRDGEARGTEACGGGVRQPVAAGDEAAVGSDGRVCGEWRAGDRQPGADARGFGVRQSVQYISQRRVAAGGRSAVPAWRHCRRWRSRRGRTICIS